jgi:hypothetical protein
MTIIRRHMQLVATVLTDTSINFHILTIKLNNPTIHAFYISCEHRCWDCCLDRSNFGAAVGGIDSISSNRRNLHVRGESLDSGWNVRRDDSRGDADSKRGVCSGCSASSRF